MVMLVPAVLPNCLPSARRQKFVPVVRGLPENSKWRSSPRPAARTGSDLDVELFFLPPQWLPHRGWRGTYRNHAWHLLLEIVAGPVREAHAAPPTQKLPSTNVWPCLDP